MPRIKKSIINFPPSLLGHEAIRALSKNPEKYQGMSKALAVNVYGEREAFKLAKAFRQEGLRSLEKK